MLLDDLNQSQRDAVLCCDCPSLVIAGAGSGKTRVITYKIAYLLEQGLEPWRILALTFTNKAAREMKERIGKLVNEDQARYLWAGTFHSIFGKILRYESDYIGFTSDFTIYDTPDSKSLIKSIIRDMQLDEKKYKPSSVLSHISMAKNSLIMPADYRKSHRLLERDRAQNMGDLCNIYEEYMQRCKKSNAMDFDDMLIYTWKLFKEHPDIAQKYQEKFQYILVDEYQDTNYAQHQIVLQLTGNHQHVCVVGDDAQSIYSFRGAKIDNILNFQKLYNGVKLFKLEQNYRSTQTIVSAANSLIQHNVQQIRKDVYSKGDVGDPIEVCKAYSDVDEANIVVRKIRGLIAKNNIKFKETAILYRTNAQSRSLEDALRKQNIPYRIYGGTSFYQRKEIKDVIAYFRLAVNPYDEEALKRIINYPNRKIGETTVGKVMQAAAAHDLSPWEILNHPDLVEVNNPTKERLKSFADMMLSFREVALSQDAYNVGLKIVDESGIRADIFHSSEPEDLSRQENLQEMLDGMASFVQERVEAGGGYMLTHYLSEVSLLTDMDEDDSEGDNKVTLMTVHAAKGLEFEAVFVVGLEEELFPSQMSMDSPRQIEEERRLFYVAMTRAKKHLFLTYARRRMKYGVTSDCEPSRFLKDIDKRFLKSDKPEMPSFKDIVSRPTFIPQRPRVIPQAPPSNFIKVRKTVSESQPSPSVPSSINGLTVGSVIVHERFGEGVVERLEGSGLDAKACVRFQNVGTKQLLLRFARFTLKH
ncbi:MAG: UvrD-helicase domain-containing protein [Bacteroidaceae bacterium]|nr:UvrD-helicase domain-containing protein [Bacteroidaceae bacterium]